MKQIEREQLLNALSDLMTFLKRERVLREFPFFANAYEILNSDSVDLESLRELKNLLLRGMEFAAPGSFSDLGFWKENKEERLQLNKELDVLSNRLLELVRNMDLHG